MKKKYLFIAIPAFVLLLLIVIVIAAVIFFLVFGGSYDDTEQAITDYVSENKEDLLKKCEDWVNTGQKPFQETEQANPIQKIKYKKKDKCIIFVSHSDGLVSSSVELGFYYSYDDNAKYDAVGWAPMDMKPETDGNEIRWEYEPGGDVYSTQKITGHFYYYYAAN